MEKDGDYLLLVGFCICAFCMYKSPCQQVSEMKKMRRKCREEWNSPVCGICGLLASRCVVCRFVVIPAVTAFCCLFHGILGLCMHASVSLQSFSVVLPSAWCLSVVTDGHTFSDWLPGPMLVDVHLGVICVVIGSFLICFSSLCFMFLIRKGLFISVLSQHEQLTCQWRLNKSWPKSAKLMMSVYQARFHAKNLQNNGKQDIAQRTKFLKVLRQPGQASSSLARLLLSMATLKATFRW